MPSFLSFFRFCPGSEKQGYQPLKQQEEGEGSQRELVRVGEQQSQDQSSMLTIREFIWELLAACRSSYLFAWSITLACVKVSSGWEGQDKRLPYFFNTMFPLLVVAVGLRMAAQMMNKSKKAELLDVIKDYITQSIVFFVYALQFSIDAWLFTKYKLFKEDPEVSISSWEASLILGGVFAAAAISTVVAAYSAYRKVKSQSSKAAQVAIFAYYWLLNAAIIHGFSRLLNDPFSAGPSVPMLLNPPNTPPMPTIDWEKLGFNVLLGTIVGGAFEVGRTIAVCCSPESIQTKTNKIIRSVLPTFACGILGYMVESIPKSAESMKAVSAEVAEVWNALFFASLALPILGTLTVYAKWYWSSKVPTKQKPVEIISEEKKEEEIISKELLKEQKSEEKEEVIQVYQIGEGNDSIFKEEEIKEGQYLWIPPSLRIF